MENVESFDLRIPRCFARSSTSKRCDKKKGKRREKYAWIQYHITWRVAALFKRTKNSLRSFHYFDLRESWKRICFVYWVAKVDRLSVELLWGLCVIEDGVGRRLQRVWQMCLPSDLVETSLELVICFHNVCCEGDSHHHRNMYVWHEVPLQRVLSTSPYLGWKFKVKSSKPISIFKILSCEVNSSSFKSI